ncbi:DivIVA domain-containing protein [Peribacillus alkalitolerans]|uniref:DivIVA domain-containing protein n=1 Tax=Peribacillus alkalitolerans TaxID=1550385 RepID=UPI003B84659D
MNPLLLMASKSFQEWRKLMHPKLLELIQVFPQLKEAYRLKISDGYTLTNIHISSLVPVHDLTYTTIELIIEIQLGETILLRYTEGIVHSFIIEPLSSTKDRIHPNILLNKELIHNKDFRKKFFGGYDEDEVNHFLDIIIKDYKFVEEGLIKENNMLKEDIKKLRGH